METLFGGPIADALDHRVVTPGDTIDFSNSAIHFVYSWQRWVERRVAVAKQFGPSAPRILLDVHELERWNELRQAWKQLERDVERNRPKAR